MSRVGSGGISVVFYSLEKKTFALFSLSLSPFCLSLSLPDTPLIFLSALLDPLLQKDLALARVVKDLDEPAHPAGPPTYSATRLQLLFGLPLESSVEK